MDPNHLEQFVCFLTHIQDASCDFGEYAKERGSSRKDNALRDFKKMVKKYGLLYDGKKFVTTGEGDSNQSAPPTPSPAKKATPRKRKVKDEEHADGENNDASPKKKPARKPKKEDIKTENSDEDVENNDDAEV